MMNVGPGATIMLRQQADGSWHAVCASHTRVGMSWATAATPIDACAEVLTMSGVQNVKLASRSTVGRLEQAFDRAIKAEDGKP